MILIHFRFQYGDRKVSQTENPNSFIKTLHREIERRCKRELKRLAFPSSLRNYRGKEENSFKKFIYNIGSVQMSEQIIFNGSIRKDIHICIHESWRQINKSSRRLFFFPKLFFCRIGRNWIGGDPIFVHGWRNAVERIQTMLRMYNRP